MTKNTRFYLPYLVFGALCVTFYLWLAAKVPYSGDDWDWGLEIGLHHLLTADINSRYVGNFFAVIMTRSPFLKTVIMGLTMFLIPFFLTHFIIKGNWQGNSVRNLILFSVMNILLLTASSFVWRQTYGWVSGFANFCISALFLVLYLCVVQPLWEEYPTIQKHSLPVDFLLFAMGIAMQLFLENIAVYLVAASCIVCIISLFRLKKIPRQYAFLLLGNLIGVCIMFSSSMFTDLFSTGQAVGGVRWLTFYLNSGPIGTILRCLSIFVTQHIPLIWENNAIICCSTSIILSFLLKQDLQSRFRHIFIPVNYVFAVYYFCTFCSHLCFETFLFEYHSMLGIVMNLSFFLCVSLQFILLYRKNVCMLWKFLLLWFSAPIVIAPLSAIANEGGRFYYTSNVFLVLCFGMLLETALTSLAAPKLKIIAIICFLILALLCTFYIVVYHDIGICAANRSECIAEAKSSNSSSIVLPAYPHDSYLWDADPLQEHRMVYFKEFFGISQDVQVLIADP